MLPVIIVNIELILFSIVVNVADIRPKVKYIVAVDDSRNTLEEIVKVDIDLN